MAQEFRPLSDLVAQGWEVAGYSTAYDQRRLALVHSFLLRRQKRHMALKVRKKFFGSGVTSEQIEL